MPADSKKLKRLRDMRESLAAGKFTEKDLKTLRVSDTDGRVVRLGDDDALDVIDRRIGEETEAMATLAAPVVQAQPAAVAAPVAQQPTAGV